MTEPKPRFKVAEIAIDEDGTFWFNYVGTHPDQGGLSYRWGSIGLSSPEDFGSVSAVIFKKELPEYLQQIKKKTSTKPGS